MPAGGRSAEAVAGAFRDYRLYPPDFEDYCVAHEEACALYREHEEWTRKAILNTASMGWFSSDRTVKEYADEIWGVQPVIPERSGDGFR